MNLIQILFIIGLFTIFYAYAGYGLVLYLIIKIKRILVPVKTYRNPSYEPTVSFIIPCYNEAEIIEDKIRNTLALHYPENKLQIIFITDGSTDGSEKVAARHPAVSVMHQSERRGKSAAENRSVALATGEIIIFSDANTVLPPEAVHQLVKHYVDPMVGAVSGEKKIMQDKKENAAGAGEGIYWKYESQLKKWDAELLTIVGAAGELLSFRRHLYEPLEEDTILDDFLLTMRITEKGYRVLYEPKATALETASSNTKEELKRKIRICAGGWQAMSRLGSSLNVLRHPTLSFQYISHRVLRWTLAPLFLVLLIPFNIYLAIGDSFYMKVLFLQALFYVAAGLGWILENKSIRIKTLFVPYYFVMMNYAAIAGFLRFMKGKQSSAWERSERKIILDRQPV